MTVKGGGEETPLSTVKLCEIGVPPNMALDMNRNLPLSISYLLKDECEKLRV